MKIAVIGGGFTGVVGAYRLALLGHQVTLIEKNSFLGGLASGFKLAGKYEIEKAYHHLFSTDSAAINLINELGLEDHLSWHKSSISVFFDKKLYSFSTPWDLIKIPILSPIAKLRFSLASMFLKYSNNVEVFESFAAYDWLKKYMGEEVTETIWKPLLIGKFGNFYDKVSMAWLWARIHTRVNSRKSFDHELLGYMHGSFYRIIEVLADKLSELGVKILLNTEIKQIIPHDNGVLLNIMDQSEELFDKVFCTFSNNAFVNYFDNIAVNADQRNYLANLKKIIYLDSICMVFSSSQSLSNFYWHNINDLKIPFLVFIQHTNLVNTSFYGNKHVFYVGKYFQKNDYLLKESDEVIIRLWFNGIKEIFPNFDEKLVDNIYIFRFKDAQHVVDIKYSKNIPSYKTPFKNVYLVNFSQIYPEDRGINFAIREGNKFGDILYY